MSTNLPQSGQNLLNPMIAQQQGQGLRAQPNNAPAVSLQQMGQMANVNILGAQSNQMPQPSPNPQLLQTPPFFNAHLPGQSNQQLRPMNVNMQPFVQTASIPSITVPGAPISMTSLPMPYAQIQPARSSQSQASEYSDIVSRQKLQEIVSQIDNKEKLDPDAEEVRLSFRLLNLTLC
jgi:hypothetical protein